ncbi:MAG: flagellar hook-associated protein FlgK [Planctomycetota bacterium]
MSFRTLNIGATALLTQQLALDTVGHNIANASTPGYTRQRVATQANLPDIKTFGAIGTGVGVLNIRRIADEFLEGQVREAVTLQSYLESKVQTYENLEAIFNELTENDVSTYFDDFWNALGDVNNQVEDISTRRAFANEAVVLADAFQGLDTKLRNMREWVNRNVVSSVAEINTLITEIARLNQEILRAEQGGTGPVVANDARDQRTTRLKELAGLLDIKVVEEENGSMVVSIGGRLLVFENQFFRLATAQENSDDILIDVAVFESDQDEVDARGGRLCALQELRDSIVMGYKEDIDRLAGRFLWEFNRIHSQGRGLTRYSRIQSTTQILNPTASLDELSYNFTPVSETYGIQNGNLELKVFNEVTGEETTLNIEIDLDGTAETDTIFYDASVPPPARNNALVNKIRNALEDRFSGLFTVSVDAYNRVTIESSSSDYTFGFGRDASRVLAALGLNTFFSGFDAGTIAVRSEYLDSPDYFAAARSFEAGDNQNAVALLQMRETLLYNNRTATVDDFYQGVVGRLGVEFGQTKNLLETQEDILLRVENQREDLSGVNLDEELTRMIQFQRSYQSAARFISVANTLYDALMDI